MLSKAETVAGYTTYIDLVRPLVAGKEIVRTGMKKEVDRVAAAIKLAPDDSSRDGKLYLEVVPGIPALCAGGALLGAPLTHDFAAISLSDLLTPWEKIAIRLKAAAAADFVIVLYNPKSRKRQNHLRRAQEIVLRYRDGATPVGIVARAMRAGQRVWLTRLDRLDAAEVDMQTTVFIGNGDTLIYEECLITPRGYTEKYDLQ
ncbi:MAG: precorrin-3B C(17)-methyltransferase [Desulfosarcinaceae bacterium]